MVTMPSGEMRMKALGVSTAGGGPCGACARAFSTGSTYAESSKPPPATAVTRRNERRPIVLMVLGSRASNVFIGPPYLRPTVCWVVTRPHPAGRVDFRNNRDYTPVEANWQQLAGSGVHRGSRALRQTT